MQPPSSPQPTAPVVSADAHLSHYERMTAGHPYHADDPYLAQLRAEAVQLATEHQAVFEESEYGHRVLYGLFARLGPGALVRPPFSVLYGPHVEAGEKLRVGSGVYLEDAAPIRLGDRVRLDAGVKLLTIEAPAGAENRAKGAERAKPVTLGDDVWLGAGTIVCPGVTIGAGVVVPPGTVVTSDRVA